jgi:hypothetical protein
MQFITDMAPFTRFILLLIICVISTIITTVHITLYFFKDKEPKYLLPLFIVSAVLWFILVNSIDTVIHV